MVSGSARPRRRSDRRWLRRRIGFDDYSDPRDDPDQRLRSDILMVRPRPGAGRDRTLLSTESAKGGRSAALDTSAAIAARLYAGGGPRLADLLGDVYHVCSGRRRWPDGNGAAGADRRRLSDRQDSCVVARADAPSADLCVVDRPGAERTDAALFRLGVRSHRPREHDVYRLRFRGRRYLGAQPIRPRPGAVRSAERGGVFRLGGDLLTLPLDLHRRLWREVRDDQRGSALYREGNRRAARAARQRASGGER